MYSKMTSTFQNHKMCCKVWSNNVIMITVCCTEFLNKCFNCMYHSVNQLVCFACFVFLFVLAVGNVDSAQ